MRSTIGMLLEGDARIVGYFQTAVSKWKALLGRGLLDADHKSQHGILRSAQWQFEDDCGGRELGKELMGFVGVAMLAYSEEEGHWEKAAALAEMLEASRNTLSLEVQGAARDAREFLL